MFAQLTFASQHLLSHQWLFCGCRKTPVFQLQFSPPVRNLNKTKTKILNVSALTSYDMLPNMLVCINSCLLRLLLCVGNSWRIEFKYVPYSCQPVAVRTKLCCLYPSAYSQHICRLMQSYVVGISKSNPFYSCRL